MTNTTVPALSAPPAEIIDRATPPLAAPLSSSRGASSGTLEAVKWLAIVAMALDHVDAILYARDLGWPTAIGRLAMPLFAYILASNLARNSQNRRPYLQRLLLWGLISEPVYILAFGHFGPDPILCLGAIVAMIHFAERPARHPTARVLVPLAGAAVASYGGYGAGLPLLAASIYLSVKPTKETSFPTAGAKTCQFALTPIAICLLNGGPATMDSFFALLAYPIMLIANSARIPLPRCPPVVFYAFYPGHLAILILFRWLSS